MDTFDENCEMTPENVASADLAVSTRGLAKSYGIFHALTGVNINVTRGTTLAIFGPNGAGKTTLIKMLAGVMRPSAGSITIEGLDMQEDASRLRSRIGLLSHHSFLYGSLSAEENLSFYASMYGVADAPQRIAQLLERVGLKSRRYDRVASFSRGMLQRLSLARALLHQPYVLMLDEPETGLDRQGLDDMWSIIKSDTPQRTVIFTSHNFERALAACSDVLILNRGRVAFSTASQGLSADELQQIYHRETGEKR